MKAEVYVTLKREVLDPQGDAVKRSLHELGHAGVVSVRVGKYIELEVEDGTDAATIRAMCEQLLANSVIEDFRFELS